LFFWTILDHAVLASGSIACGTIMVRQTEISVVPAFIGTTGASTALPSGERASVRGRGLALPGLRCGHGIAGDLIEFYRLHVNQAENVNEDDPDTDEQARQHAAGGTMNSMIDWVKH
jgi:hypothetical protein